MIHPRPEVRQLRTDKVQIYVVEGPGAGGGPKEPFSPRKRPPFRNPGSKMQELRHGLQVWETLALWMRTPGCDGRQCRYPGRGEGMRQRERRQSGVDLKG